MAPVPLEGHLTPMSGMQHCLPSSGGNSIPITVLIDFILQRTYHELTILSELLPRKTDVERKMEIVQFASRTHQLFVRLLALVKWANSASKVDKCAAIMQFLDKQSMLFVETADMLAKMARETLVHARLPNFHLPCAVEVLTTGTYMRLPTCIRDRIVPPDPITLLEKRTTLQRLNQIIEHRLVTGSDLPPQMRNITIDNGRVMFRMDHEFEASLTLMGDGPNVPWRLLDVAILVEDKETGDGKSLVHPLQVQYIHQLAQSRLVNNPQPLHDLYGVLHCFCQSLQLEVLHSQAVRLCAERLGDYIQVDYIPGNCLTVLYWRDLPVDGSNEVGYRLTVQVHSDDTRKPLQVIHFPKLGLVESLQADQAIKSDQLSIEKLLVYTMYMRTKQRLIRLKDELLLSLGYLDCAVTGSPAVLQVPILQPCLRSEQLLVAIDTHKGSFLTHIPQHEPPMILEIQNALNSDQTKLQALVAELRYWIVLRRCEKTLQHLPIMTTEKLPLLHAPNHPIADLAPHHLFVKLCKNANSYVIVEVQDRPGSPCEVELSYHLLVVKPVNLDEEAAQHSVAEMPRCFLSVFSMVEFDAFTITHGPFNMVDGDYDQPDKDFGKRRSIGAKSGGTETVKRSKPPAYFIPELAHIVAMCDERLPFAAFVEELNKHSVSNQGVQVDANGTCLVAKIVQMPDCDGVDSDVMDNLRRSLLSCSVRLQGKGTRSCLVEYILCRCPLSSLNSREQGARRLVYFLYDLSSADLVARAVDDFLADWNSIANLYKCVLGYATAIKQDHSIETIAEVKCYPYRRLVLGYGPNKANVVTITWRPAEKQFHLTFGVVGPTASATNPHTQTALELQHHFNRHCCISWLLKVLRDTYSPLNSILKLPTVPVMGATNSRPSFPVRAFTILPQSPIHVRIAYRYIYCLDVYMRNDDVVTIRDGAYSLFDKGKAIEDFSPTQGLKAFLSRYVDDSACQVRRRSQSEDDNPPSPVATVDPLDSLMSSHAKPCSPAQRSQEAGLRFHHPLTPPSSSNPHTPASPHTSVLSQSYTASPAASFQLASPPSLQNNINPSPSMMHMGTPSPSTLLTANSPGNLHVPSPGSFMPTPSPSSHLQSPASSFMGHAEGGSPFPSGQSGLSMPSPATQQQWPSSPSVPRPSPAGGRGGGLSAAQSPGHPALHSPQSVGLAGDVGKNAGQPQQPMRILPQRSWAAAVPTMLTHDAFDALCVPAPVPGIISNATGGSPLERFLSCVYLRRSLQRLIQNESESNSGMMLISCSEPGVVLFKVEQFQCRIAHDSNHMQTLHLKISPLLDHKDQWSQDELQTFERYFDTKVACSPYKPSMLMSFARLLAAPIRILKDVLGIMRLDMCPDRGHKWAVQWCLTIPPAASSVGPMGTMAFHIIKTKFLFFIQLSRQMYGGAEPMTLVLPLVYDMVNNTTQLAERRELSSASPSTSINSIVVNTLKRFAEFSTNPSECSIFPAVRELLNNLIIPH